MQTQDLTSAQADLLKKPLPPEAIKPHPTKPYLSSIKAIYVTERLNDVFGIGGWKVTNEIIEKSDKFIIVKAVLTVDKYGIYIEQFGGNDNADPGDAYKGAATDALTKICSYMGIGADIWKSCGNSNGNGQNNKQPDNNLPWLNERTAEMESVKDGLQKGYTIDQVKTKYRLSKKIEEQLTEYIKTVNPAP